MRPGVYSLRMPFNPSQHCGTVGLSNNRNIVNRSKVDNFITSNCRNNTNIACSLNSVNVIIIILLLFLKDYISKNNKQFLVSILFFSTILLIPFVFFFSLLLSLRGDVKVNLGPHRKPNDALSVSHWNLNSISVHNFSSSSSLVNTSVAIKNM